MSEYDYTGNKTKNFFTAYLQKCIRWKRKNYLQKKVKINNMEKSLEENKKVEYSMTVEAMVDMYNKEELLLKESNGNYLKWNELSDQRLVSSLLLLNENERRLIFQHIFEKKSFEEMEILNGMTKERCKGIYCYAIRKIRNWVMGQNGL